MSERLRPKDRWGRSVLCDDARVTELLGRAPAKLVDLPQLRITLVHAVNNNQWFVVCALCSVIGELMFAALDVSGKSDMFPKLDALRLPAKKQGSKHKRRNHRRNEAYLPLAALRHTCFHPAMSAPIRDLPRDVFVAMASLHTDAAADWALEQLERALCFELEIARDE